MWLHQTDGLTSQANTVSQKARRDSKSRKYVQRHTLCYTKCFPSIWKDTNLTKQNLYKSGYSTTIRCASVFVHNNRKAKERATRGGGGWGWGSPLFLSFYTVCESPFYRLWISLFFAFFVAPWNAIDDQWSSTQNPNRKSYAKKDYWVVLKS